MVINGLRGLGLEVNLIGQRTNGKNVGMEGVVRSFYNYDFYLYLSASTLKMLKVLEIMHQDLFPMLKLMILPFTRVNLVRWKTS